MLSILLNSNITFFQGREANLKILTFNSTRFRYNLFFKKPVKKFLTILSIPLGSDITLGGWNFLIKHDALSIPLGSDITH